MHTRMIHYHGIPITPETVLPQAMHGAHFFVSFEYPDQLASVVEICSSFAVDNGAFSKWKAGRSSSDWSAFYAWVEKVSQIPTFDFAVIPDKIDGSESENDLLLAEWPHGKETGAPVWHLHESIKRLQRLCFDFPRVCLGSSGQFAKIGTKEWWAKMHEAMRGICGNSGLPKAKLHGLRMLDPDVFGQFPFKSADSTNIARNIGIDCRWNGSYSPPTKAARASVMRHRIESRHALPKWVDPDPMNDPMF